MVSHFIRLKDRVPKISTSKALQDLILISYCFTSPQVLIFVSSFLLQGPKACSSLCSKHASPTLSGLFPFYYYIFIQNVGLSLSILLEIIPLFPALFCSLCFIWFPKCLPLSNFLYICLCIYCLSPIKHHENKNFIYLLFLQHQAQTRYQKYLLNQQCLAHETDPRNVIRCYQ